MSGSTGVSGDGATGTSGDGAAGSNRAAGNGPASDDGTGSSSTNAGGGRDGDMAGGRSAGGADGDVTIAATGGAGGGEAARVAKAREEAERARLEADKARVEAERAVQAAQAAQARAEAAQAALDAEGAGRVGRVDTGRNGVQIDRDEKSVTLDGFLPTTLGMDNGQFDFDRYTLSDDVKAKLDVITEKLGTAPYDRLYVTGYSDRIGDSAYNKNLSEKRAWAVAGYLMEKGVPPEKLKVEGKGEANSLVSGGECMNLMRAELIECLQRDRRVELLATVKEYNLKVK